MVKLMAKAAGSGKPPTYKDLMALAGIGGLSIEDALGNIAHLVDACHKPRHAAGITKALQWCDELEARGLDPVQLTTLEYFRSNAWDYRRPRHQTGISGWQWEQPALQEEILILRRARYGEGFDKSPVHLQCQILTNLGNQLTAAGRVIEALEPRRHALAIAPSFWMARGTLAMSLASYARLLHSDYHAAALLTVAHSELLRTIKDANAYPGYGHVEAVQRFELEKIWIDQHVDVAGFSEHFSPDQGTTGKTGAERAYRGWCLSNRIFLNPLNDGFASPAAADDTLPLPDFVTSIGDPPSLLGFFNQIKQEYVSARWALHAGTHSGGPHFSDRGVTLTNTLDYPAYGLAVEQVRTAYRIAYSLFEKIAFFINDYFLLGIGPTQVSFGRVWKNKKGPNGVLVKRFASSKNTMLRGLYWISRDLLDSSFSQSTAPDAQALSDIRNQLEHKYLKVHELFVGNPGLQQKVPGDPFVDTLAYSISRTDFEDKALRLLKLSRTAIIHLALAVDFEEKRRRRASRSKKPNFGQELPVVDHRWKA
jgi:hypothetical protein